MKKLTLALLLCVLPAVGQTPLWNGLIDQTRAVDWRNAGISGGIPSGSWTQCNTTACNAFLGANLTATIGQLNAAIASAPSNTFVPTQSGTYTNLAGDGMLFSAHSNVSVRGNGAQSTKLKLPSQHNCAGNATAVCFVNAFATYDKAGVVTPPCGGSNSSNCMVLSGTGEGGAGVYTQGATHITALTSQIGSNTPTVGTLLILDQLNDTTDIGGIMQGDLPTGTFSGNDGANGRCSTVHDCGSSNTHYSQTQVVTVTNVATVGGTTTFTISPGIYFNNIRSGQNPGAWWSGTPSTNVGLENLTIDTSGSSATSIVTFYDVNGGWLSGVETTQGPTGAQRNHVLETQSTHIVIRNGYAYGSKGAEGSYGYECTDSSDSLIEQNIWDAVASPIILDNCSGLVIDYNYEHNHLYTVNPNFLQTSLPSHDAGNGMNLFEGNYMAALDSDNQHGNSPLATVFRNWMPGNEPPPFNRTQQTQAFGVDAIGRGWNVIGNVIGTPGYHNQYEVSPNTHGGSNANCNTSLFALGWGSVAAGCSTPGGSESVGSTDLTVATSMVRWGNVTTVAPNDVATISAQWNSNEAAAPAMNFANANFDVAHFNAQPHTLVPSFVYASKPSWWACSGMNCPWPPAGPDVTGGQGPGGFAYENPAFLNYANGTFTSGVLNFNPAFYSGASVSPSLSASPATLQFNFKVVGQTSAALTSTISNTGTGTANISNVALSSGPFSISANTCGTTLAAGSTCIISAKFTPAALGVVSATITITSDDPAGPDVITLKGTGTANIVTKIFDFGAPTGAVVCNNTNTGTGLNTPAFQPNFAYTTLNYSSPTRVWVQPTTPNGHFYKVTTAGTSSTEPVWPTGSGSTVTSGTVTFTEQGTNNNKQCQDDFYLYIAPNIDGVVVAINANSVDPSNAGGTAQAAGGYTWTTVDSQINTFVNAPEWPIGGQIVELLRFISNGNTNNATPTYWLSPTYAATLGAATNDVCFCSTGQGATYEGDKPSGTNQCFNDGADKTGFPVAWQVPVQTAYNNLIAAQVAHNNAASYLPFIAYQRDSGGGPGGEAFPHCVVTLKSRFGLTNATLKTQWVNNATQIYQHIASGLPQYPWMAAADGTCTPATSGCVVGLDWADAEAAAANALGGGTGSEGLSIADIQSYNSFAYAQGGAGISGGTYSPGDYLYNFHINPASSPRELQTIAASDPTGAGTGSLVDMLAFTTGLNPAPTSVEVYHQDLMIAFDPNFPQFSTYHVAYATAIANARAGVITNPGGGTTGVSGSISISGSLGVSGGATNLPAQLGGAPAYSLSNIGLNDAGTITPLFDSHSSTSGNCTPLPECQNSVKHDITLNSASLNAITRITDGSTVPSGQSIGNLTCSAGDNNNIISPLGTYFAPVAGGAGRIYKLSITNNQIQVVNKGGIPAINPTCPFMFSRVTTTDTTLYSLASTTQAMVATIQPDASAYLSAPSLMFDYANCPGVSGIVDSGDFNGDMNDDVFTTTLSDLTGQGWGQYIVWYKKSTGKCATTNMITGAVYDYCNVSCGSASPLGTLSTSGNTCWGIPVYTGTVNTSGTAVTFASGNQFTWDSRQKEIYIGSTKYSITAQSATSLTLATSAGSQTGATYKVRIGIHGNQMSLDGNYVTVSFGAQGGWLQGACAGNTNNNQNVYVQAASLTTGWTVGASPSNHGSHSSVGVLSTLSPYFAGPNIRLNNSVASSTAFAAAVPFTDAHGSWPHPGGVDTYPWIMASDNGTSANGVPYSPKYLQAEVFGYYPLVSYPPGQRPVRFFHTFNCGGSGAACNGGAETKFGALNSIGVADPLGRFFCWVTDDLQMFGLDNNSDFRSDAVCGMLQ